MALETLTPDAQSAADAIEPSRAWILGLVVEPDGSMSGPGSDAGPDWVLATMAPGENEVRSAGDGRTGSDARER